MMTENLDATDDLDSESPNEVIVGPVVADRLLPWLAALASARIPYRVAYGDGGPQIHVPNEQAERAWSELKSYEAANADWPQPLRPDRALPKPDLAIATSLIPTVLLVYFHLKTGEFDPHTGWFKAGMATTHASFSGEWWRSVTALTLHADLGHALGNAACCLLFGAALGQLLGPGTAWLVLVLGGVLGNVLAHLVGPEFRQSVGASTATFSALGTLAVLQFYRLYRRHGSLRSIWARPWLPLLAGAGLLAFLGAGPRADIAAHAWGFAVGLALGAPCIFLLFPQRAWPQWACGAAVTALVLAAWRAASLSL